MTSLKSLVKIELNGSPVMKAKIQIAWPGNGDPHPFDIKADAVSMILNEITIHHNQITKTIERSLFSRRLFKYGSVLVLKCPTEERHRMRVAEQDGREVIEIFFNGSFRKLGDIPFCDLLSRNQKLELAKTAAVAMKHQDRKPISSHDLEVKSARYEVANKSFVFFRARANESVIFSKEKIRRR